VGKRKGITILLCVMMMLSLITACAKDNTGKSTAPEKETNKVTETEKQPDPATPTETEAPKRTGTINISLPNASASVWNAVANGYMEENPGVKVTVDNKPAEGYKEWLMAQLAAGKPEVDLVVNNEVAALMSSGAFMDYYPYFDKENPYTGNPWKDSLDLETMGINIDGVGPDDHLYNLNFESVQIVWVYNKEIFEKVGFKEAPKTFNQLIEAFQKVKAAGYVPLALGGDSTSMWSGQAGWLVRIYADQFLRDYITITHSQDGDYTYLPEIDKSWSFDPTDPYNDANSKITKNEMRLWKAIKDKTGPFQIAGNVKWKAYADNLKELFKYVPDGFFGLKEEQAYNLFLTGKAATMVGTPGSYWQLPKDFADGSEAGDKGAVKPFEYGFFNMPSMEGPEVMAPARTIQIPIGFYGIVNKDAQQNELNADFMMYLTSPKGYGKYLQAIQDSTDASLAGAPALKGISLPAEMAKAFADFEPIGNTEGYPSPGNSIARGLWDYQPSVQEWVGSVQRFFSGELTTDQYLVQMQANIDKNLVATLKERNLELSDLDNPERKPPVRN